jgi:hypothetical protein
MNAAAPKGMPPRRVNNVEHFGKHGTAPPRLGVDLNRGALISAIYMVLVRTLRSCPFLQSRNNYSFLSWFSPPDPIVIPAFLIR